MRGYLFAKKARGIQYRPELSGVGNMENVEAASSKEHTVILNKTMGARSLDFIL
jgi:hypothetical protein